jgi:myo-inositol-1(or 4)-monophosphatase
MDLQAVRALTEDIATRAGDIIMSYWGKTYETTTKRNIFDIVTEADKAADVFIVGALRDAFPDHHIVSEEGGGSGAAAEEAAYFWHIDPVDGTANFAHRLPYFSVSIGLSDNAYQPLVGVVFNPVYREMFSAVRSGGATLNGERLHVADTADLNQAMLISGFSPDRELARENMHYWEQFQYVTRGTRRMGSAALDLSYVASGRVDGFWEKHVNSWDVMAGLLCVLEAGGRLSDYSGQLSRRVFTGEEFVASNGLVHDAMLAVLNGR